MKIKGNIVHLVGKLFQCIIFVTFWTISIHHFRQNFIPLHQSLKVYNCFMRNSCIFIGLCFKVIGLSIQEVWSDLEGKKFVSGNDLLDLGKRKVSFWEISKSSCWVSTSSCFSFMGICFSFFGHLCFHFIALFSLY